MNIPLTLAMASLSLVSAQAAPAPEPVLPAPKDVFVVAIHPMWQTGPYFTADSLISSLPNFKPITPHHKEGDRRVCQNAGLRTWRNDSVGNS